jgi:hypothetical protein
LALELDYTPLWLGFGVGVATLLLHKFRKVEPLVSFEDIVLDEEDDQIKLKVKNTTTDTVYVRPSIRKITFNSPREWRGVTAQQDYLPAQGVSVIKSFELLGEYAEGIKIRPGQEIEVEYPVRQGFHLNMFDNIRVDAQCGRDKTKLEGSSTSTLQLKIRHKKLHAPLADEEWEPVGASIKPAAEEAIDSSSSDARMASLPVLAECSNCRQVRWLNWVQGEQHICDNCHDTSTQSYPTQSGGVPGPTMEEADTGEDDDLLGDFEIDSMDAVSLKPRHIEILNLLEIEDKITVKQAAKKLKRSKESISCDLRYLFKQKLLDRVKIGRAYHYFSLRDRNQILLYEDDEQLVEESQWT